MTALVAECGDRIQLQLDRWRGDVDAAEWAHVAALDDPVLDVGCGPGRIVAALIAAGRPALGIDVAAGAVAEARVRGASVLQRSVFAPLPGEGRWGGVVLLDGNIGIGGDPPALLQRSYELLRPGGGILVEVDPPGGRTRQLAVRIESWPRRPSPWFRWAVVAADDIVALLREAGFDDVVSTCSDDRWFATGTRR